MHICTNWQEILENHLQSSQKPLIVVIGPTASGKTAFSLNIAEYLNNLKNSGKWKGAEIINADSRQLYRHMNIGTAKITEEEKRGVVHHLIDEVDPNEEINIAWYKERAAKIIDDCHSRSIVPIFVGGSMLYISAIVDGLDPLPTAPPELRAKIEAAYDEDDGWALYDRLEKIDPVTASAFDKQNKHYVVRAMELWEMTGIAPSKLKKTIPPPYDILMFGMHWPRTELTERINMRAKQMLDAGWIEEVEGLIDRGYSAKDPGMKSHGYKEVIQWLSSEDRNKEELEKVIASKTRQYAKRQMTWWKDDERINWIDAKQL
jgi:tRNA dimethylallyltransferase